MTKHNNANIFSPRNRYIPALLIIFIMATFGYINVKDIMDSIQKDGEIINLSGRQRMLSQKLVLLAENYVSTPNDVTKHRLKSSMNLLLDSHNILIKELETVELRKLYFEDYFDKDVRDYLDSFEELIISKDEKILDSLRDSSQVMLAKFEFAVKEYEKADKLKLEELENRERIIFIATIIVLLLEGIFIFYPASRKMRRNTRELQNAIHDKTKELQKSIDMISDYVIYSQTDLKGRIIYASNAFCNTSGYSREELLGEPHNIVRHPDMPSSAFAEMWATIKTGKSWRGEVKNQKKNGGFYWVDANISPEYDSEGKLVGYAGVRLDITSKKELEELNENLENKISKEVEENRKKDLQLNEQSKQIQMAELMGNIAHQWRQPLTFISTLASGMKLQKELDMLSDEDSYKGLENIIQKTKYLSDIINTFTNFIKEENKVSIFNLQEKMDETVNIISNTLENYNIKLIKNFENEPIELKSIASYLSHAVLNIITNAKDIIIDRNINDGVITLAIQKSDMGIEITIEDNAGGIDEDIIDKIFDPYFTTKHQSQGVGMGLHNSYNFIVNELHGKLYVKNNENGAKFFITLPY